jgi:hypothetical protein
VYNPMKKQGAIVLGSGGDCCATNTNLSVGTFYEGAMGVRLPERRDRERRPGERRRGRLPVTGPFAGRCPAAWMPFGTTEST